MPTGLAVLCAGGLGALSRWWLDGLVTRRVSGFPLGILIVNVTGAFALGLVATLLSDRFHVPMWARAALTTGLLGGYTTFSTLSHDTVRLFQDGNAGLALANSLGSLAAGLLAAYLGILAGRLV